jgi:hypothetical protein
MPLIIAGASSGSTTIQATDAVTQTITLPNNTGTIITTGSTGQSIPKAALPTGSILQVVSSTTTSGDSSTTSATFVDSGFSASITPTSTSSKIFVIFNFNLQASSSGGQAQSNVTLFRSSTNIMNTNGNLLYNNTTSANIHAPTTLTIVDSPNTTSSVTYSLRHRALTSTTSIITTGSGAVTITLMEIAA